MPYQTIIDPGAVIGVQPQPQLVDCGASEETQAELADLVRYLKAVRDTVTGRLGLSRAQRH